MLSIEGIVEDIHILQEKLKEEVTGKCAGRETALNKSLEVVLDMLNCYVVEEIAEEDFKDILEDEDLGNLSEILNELDYDVECNELYKIE